MITIKEYADKHNKTVQAVYKQLNSRTNKEKLRPHILIKEQNGKKIKFLDEEAEKILDNSSLSDKVILQQTDSKELIDQLKEENQNLLKKIATLQDTIINLNDKYSSMQIEMTAIKGQIEYKDQTLVQKEKESELLRSELSSKEDELKKYKPFLFGLYKKEK